MGRTDWLGRLRFDGLRASGSKFRWTKRQRVRRSWRPEVLERRTAPGEMTFAAAGMFVLPELLGDADSLGEALPQADDGPAPPDGSAPLDERPAASASARVKGISSSIATPEATKGSVSGREARRSQEAVDPSRVLGEDLLDDLLGPAIANIPTAAPIVPAVGPLNLAPVIDSAPKAGGGGGGGGANGGGGVGGAIRGGFGGGEGATGAGRAVVVGAGGAEAPATEVPAADSDHGTGYGTDSGCGCESASYLDRGYGTGDGSGIAMSLGSGFGSGSGSASGPGSACGNTSMSVVDAHDDYYTGITIRSSAHHRTTRRSGTMITHAAA